MDEGVPSSIKEQIRARNEKSLDYLRDIRENPDDFIAVSKNIKAFVLHRFFLVEDNPDTDGIAELSKLSIEKLLEVNKRGMLQDLSNNCAGVSSETMKKALLIMTLQKQLGVVFDPMKNDTVSQLAQSVVEQLGSS